MVLNSCGFPQNNNWTAPLPIHERLSVSHNQTCLLRELVSRTARKHRKSISVGKSHQKRGQEPWSKIKQKGKEGAKASGKGDDHLRLSIWTGTLNMSGDLQYKNPINTLTSIAKPKPRSWLLETKNSMATSYPVNRISSRFPYVLVISDSTDDQQLVEHVIKRSNLGAGNCCE